MAVASNRIWAKELIRFVNGSPSPYHAVHELKGRLLKAGFEELIESDQKWVLKEGKQYFVSRQGSALLAFVVPQQVHPSRTGCIVGAAHVDSPCLRVRPVSSRPPSDGFIQVGVETYGGGLWHTWFDRDLAVAGRIITENASQSFNEHLVDSAQPIMRIPTLAIHLDRSVSSEGFKFNNETHLLPVLASDLLNSQYRSGPATDSHNEAMIKSLLKDKAVQGNRVLAVDLCLYDAQPAAIGGVHDEFIFGARMDNLCMSFCVLQGLLKSTDNNTESHHFKIGAWFDHEEVGSCSAVGAEGGLFEATMARIAATFSLDYHPLMARSLVVSADMAHAAHPNYPEKHERVMRPQLHRGTVIKYNAQQRYATSIHSAAIVKSIASKHGIPVQEFEVRNDSPCGSTIGPMLGASSGALCVDIGLPQLSMHSIREMVSVDDVDHGVNLLGALYDNYSPLVNA
jgi:aspartyl aminopeptidase